METDVVALRRILWESIMIGQNQNCRLGDKRRVVGARVAHPLVALLLPLLLLLVTAFLAPALPYQQAHAVTNQPSLTNRHPDAGIWVMYRGKNSVEDLQKPYIKGVMAYATWGATYKGEGNFNWYTIDSELNFIINQAGKKAMIDVTAGYCPSLDWPLWMRDQVASKKEPNSFGCYPLQFWDPVYINLHKAYISALADHLAAFDASDAHPNQNDITFVRAEVMAETMENLPNDNELAKWQWQDFNPATNGRIHQEDLTKKLNFDYQAEITLTYQHELARAYGAVGLTPPVAVAKGGNYWQPYPTLDLFVQEGVWLGQHSGAPNPQGWYYDLYSRVRSGETRGASETGGKSPVTLLAQYNYWEILAALHSGIEFIGIYGNNKFSPDLQPKGAISYQENQEALSFGGTYAGTYREPATAPGAWIALRGGYPEDRFGGKVFARHMWTNYEFLIRQYKPQDSVFLFSQDQPDDVLDKIVPTIIRSNRGFGRDEIVACEKEFSPRECEYLWQFPDKYIGKSKGSHYFSYQTSDLGQVLICGEAMFCANPADATRTEAMMWARRTNGESGSPTMRFDLNDSFALSLGGRAKIRVVYLDQGEGRWELRYDSKSGAEKSALVVQKQNSNLWKEVVVELEDARFTNGQEGKTDISLFNMDDDDDIFHMIEVTRLGEPVAPSFSCELYLPDIEGQRNGLPVDSAYFAVGDLAAFPQARRSVC